MDVLTVRDTSSTTVVGDELRSEVDLVKFSLSQFLFGNRMLLIGAEAYPNLPHALRTKLGCAEVEWLTTRRTTSATKQMLCHLPDRALFRLSIRRIHNSSEEPYRPVAEGNCRGRLDIGSTVE